MSRQKKTTNKRAPVVRVLTLKQIRERRKTIARRGHAVLPHDRWEQCLKQSNKKKYVRGLRFWLSRLRRAFVELPAQQVSTRMQRAIQSIDTPTNFSNLQRMALDPSYKSTLLRERDNYKRRIRAALDAHMLPWEAHAPQSDHVRRASPRSRGFAAGPDVPNVSMLSSMLRTLNASRPTENAETPYYRLTNTPWDEKPKAEDLVWKLNKTAHALCRTMNHRRCAWPYMSGGAVATVGDTEERQVPYSINWAKSFVPSRCAGLMVTPYVAQRLERMCDRHGLLDLRYIRRVADEAELHHHWIPLSEGRLHHVLVEQQPVVVSGVRGIWTQSRTDRIMRGISKALYGGSARIYAYRLPTEPGIPLQVCAVFTKATDANCAFRRLQKSGLPTSLGNNSKPSLSYTLLRIERYCTRTHTTNIISSLN